MVIHKWLATLVLLVPLASAQIVPAPIDSQIISDLKSRSHSLAQSLETPPAAPSGDLRVSEAQATFSANAKALSKINRVLEIRKALVGNAVIVPTDPFHRSNRDYELASSDLHVAVAWWIFCQDEANRRSISPWNSLKLWARIGSRLWQSAGALAALNPKSEAVEAVGIIPLAPAIANRLKNSGKGRESVLDKIAAWDRLSDEEKSKIFAR